MADKPLSKRLISLDFFRGITIVGMIIVNTPGANNYIFGPLEHAEWNGIMPNAITAYVISGILPVVTHSAWVGETSLRSLFMSGGIATGINPYFVSFLWAVFFCFLCYIPVYYLYKNSIFVKV